MSTAHFISTFAFCLGTVMAAVCAGYALATVVAVLISAHRHPVSPPDFNEQMRPVSVLKPLHGAEPNLYENLRGFCQQAYPHYQLIVGVRDPQDPSIAVVQRLRGAFPNVCIDLVINTQVYGANLKVSNLLNMLPLVRCEWLVLADSDISVPTDYLSRVTAPLADPEVGIVTCLYYGVPNDGFWSSMGCLFIDDWFAPSVRLSHVLGSTRFAFGSTIALRHDALQAVGGLEKLRDTLADDYWLGELTRRAGLRTVLSDLMVGTDVNERGLTGLWAHELRWLRTIRSIAPLGFAMSFVCFTWPVSLIGLALAPSVFSGVLVVIALGARMLRFFLIRADGPRLMPRYGLLLTPFRDLLLLFEWAVALTGWQVKWRGQVLHANKNGPIHHP
jgi:ceramide glucosyltransferase